MAITEGLPKLTKIHAGLYRAQVGSHEAQVELVPDGQGWAWTFYVDGEPAGDGWLTRREALERAVRSIEAGHFARPLIEVLS